MFYRANNSLHTFCSGAALLLLTFPIPVLSEYSGLDKWIEDRYFDAATTSFPWRNISWFEAVMHGGIKTLLFILLALILATLLLSIFSPQSLRGIVPPFWQQKRLLVYLIIALISGPLIVGLLKHTSSRVCPWNLQLYGGQLPYYFLGQEPFFNLASPGKCFPGGHSSGGYALFAFVPLLQGRARITMCLIAFALGTIMGWSRMMQGAHFLSHNLWSAWGCVATTWLCLLIFQPRHCQKVTRADTL